MDIHNKTGFNLNLTLGLLNVRSIFYKVTEVDILCNKHRFDILAINETWLNSNIEDSEISIPGYNILRNDRPTHGGGVAFYIKKEIKFKAREDIYKRHSLESCWIELSTKQGPLLIGTVYRPPSANNVYYDKFLDMLNDVSTEGKDIILLGDLNLNCLNHASNKTISSLEAMYDMKQLVKSSTRIYPMTNSQGQLYFKESLIDIVLSTLPNFHKCTSVIKSSLSDHFLVKTKINIQPAIVHKTVTYRDYNKFDADSFTKDLLNSNTLKEVTSIQDTEYAWGHFKNIFMNICNKHAPLKTRRVRIRKCPWINTEILKHIHSRDYAHRKYLKTKDENDHKAYKMLRNKTTSLIRNTKRSYYETKINDNSSNPSQMWNIINDILPAKPKDCQYIHTPDQYNKYFCEVGSKISNSFTSSKLKYQWIGQDSIYRLNFMSVTKEQVQKELESLSTNTSLDIIYMDCKLLNLAANVISQYLSHILNLSINQSVVCKDWKMARVIPAYKNKGNKEDLCNYRPISNISHIAKVVEKLINKQLMNYLIKYDLISEAQSAYRPKHSTVTALHRVMEDWLEALNDGCEVGICFLDTTKCFDSISHKILLDKLKRYGIQNDEHKWFISYLKNRTQKVMINNQYSQSGTLSTGVPQGSILGPTLFTLFINDLPNFTIKASVSIYSDDVLLYYIGKDLSDVKVYLQSAMNSISEWFCRNKLLLSTDKCGTMLITNKKSDMKLELTLNGSFIKEVDQFKYLGVIFDSQLKFDNHVQSKIPKIRKQLGALRRLSTFVSRPVLQYIYQTVIQPSLDYGITVWGLCSESSRKLINKQQYLAARIILNNFDYDNYEGQQLCGELNWRSFQDRLEYMTCCTIYKCIHGLFPNYLSDHILYEFEVHDYNTRGAINNDLYLPLPKIEKYKMSLFFYGAKIWNTLTNSLRDSSNILSFKKNYKRLYFN